MISQKKSHLSWSKFIILMPGLLVLMCCSQGGFFEASPKKVHAQSSQKKVKAPIFTLTDLKGETFSLKELKGKVVFLDFWATWCPPCVISAPAVEELAQDYKGDDVEIISVSLDTNEAAVRRFIKKLDMTTRVAMGGDSQIDLQYQVSSLPSFFIIDKKGFVQGAWAGYHPSLLNLWRKEFDRLLKA